MNLRNATLTRLLAGTAIALTAAFGTVSAANAHDELVSSDPANGATLDSSPEELSLQFSGELQELAGTQSTVIKLTSDGEEIDAEAETKGDTVTVTPQSELESGDYTLAFRVVSSDGHPVEDSIAFSIELPEASASPTASPSAVAPSTESADSTAADTAEQPEPVQDAGAALSPVVWVIIGVVVLGGLLTALVKFVRNSNGK